LSAIGDRRQPARPVAPVLESGYRFVLWLLPALEQLPRSYKFTLGDRMAVTGLNLLDHLLAAAYTRRRGEVLAQANLDIDRLRYMFRLAVDLRLLDLRRYEHAARSLDEIGRQVGGWLKSGRVEMEARDARDPTNPGEGRGDAGAP